MNKRAALLPSLILILSFLLSACMGLIPLEQEPAAGGFGPKTSAQEQQTQTFETLWKDFQDNYIYFETAQVDWRSLHDKYAQRIQAGLTPDDIDTGAVIVTGEAAKKKNAEAISAAIGS